MRLLIATENKNKAREYARIFAPFNIEVISLSDLDPSFVIEETGKTFQENAIIKAETVAKKFNRLTIADDSGLAIKALNGFPGVYSARFMNGCSYVDKCAEILKRLRNEKDRSASFHCAIALAIPGKETQVVEGVFAGEIATAYRGKEGFGYDPIFLAPQYNKTFAELGDEIKCRVSHRFIATEALLALMKKEGIIS